MEPTNKDLLLSIHKTLSTSIAPQLSDLESAKLLGIAIQTLNELIHREDGGLEARNALRDRLAALVSRGESLVGDAASIKDVWPQRPASLMQTREPEIAIEKAWRRLAALSAALLNRLGTVGDVTRRQSIQVYLREIALTEVDQKRMAPSAVTKTSTAIQDNAARFGALAQYFGSRLGGGPDFAIREVKQLAGGFSNQTFKLMAGDPGGETRAIVVRISRDNSIQWPYTATLEEELPFIEMAHAAGLPVPRQLWHEKDASILGAPFHVMDYVPGVILGSSLKADNPVSDTLIDNVARVLAQMHRMSWQSWVGRLPSRIAPRPDLTMTDAMDLILDRMRTYLNAASLSPSPILLMMLDWLERNRPTGNDSPVVTHGDLGFHNWLFVGDTPTAVLDWENVALCSPTKDLANVADCLIPKHQWNHFIQCYVKAGGKPPVQSELRYYEVLRTIQATICCAGAMEKMFLAVDPHNIMFLELGIGARDYFYRQAADGLKDFVGASE